MKLVVKSAPAAAKLRKNLAGLQERFDASVSAAANMAASLIKGAGDADISSAGNFGPRWTEGFEVHVEQRGLRNMQISVTHDIEYAGIFETGGTIRGNPLLWIPISGTDAVGIRAKDYSRLFSPKHQRTDGRPLLFSIDDKKPKYFGIEQVTIPKLFHINEIVKSVMGNFRVIFDREWRHGAGR